MNRYNWNTGCNFLTHYRSPGWCTRAYCNKIAHPNNPKGECVDPKSPWPVHRMMFLERAKARAKEAIEMEEGAAMFRLMTYARNLPNAA